MLSDELVQGQKTDNELRKLIDNLDEVIRELDDDIEEVSGSKSREPAPELRSPMPSQTNIGVLKHPNDAEKDFTTVTATPETTSDAAIGSPSTSLESTGGDCDTFPLPASKASSYGRGFEYDELGEEWGCGLPSEDMEPPAVEEASTETMADTISPAAVPTGEKEAVDHGHLDTEKLRQDRKLKRLSVNASENWKLDRASSPDKSQTTNIEKDLEEISTANTEQSVIEARGEEEDQAQDIVESAWCSLQLN